MSDRPHAHVPHPRDLLHRQPGLSHRLFLPSGLGFLAAATNRLAFFAAAFYGGAATIVVFLAYSVISGLAKGNAQLTLLTWSNGVQLVFCAVMTYVGNQLAKQAQAKGDADHEALTHIAQAADDTRAAVGKLSDDVAGAMETIRSIITADAGKARPKTSREAGGDPAQRS